LKEINILVQNPQPIVISGKVPKSLLARIGCGMQALRLVKILT
jgi:hypothetical protein